MTALIRTVSVLTGLAVWFLLSASGKFSLVILPSPEQVIGEGARMLNDGYGDGTLWASYSVTMRRLAIGMLAAIVVGITVGLAMAAARPVRDLLDPPIEFYRPLPSIAYYSILLLWFGLGELSMVIVLALAAFPPIALETNQAALSVRRERIEGARSLGLTRLQRLVWVILPSSLPSIVVGIRIGAGLAYTTVVGAEMVASTDGIGWMIFNATQYLEPATVIIGLIIIGLTGMIIDALLVAVNDKLLKWSRYA